MRAPRMRESGMCMDREKVYGLALQGGGAKGAVHMGAVKAILERGYRIGAVAGTSIGALNGAAIAQGDFEKGYELWRTMSNAVVFAIEDTYYRRLRSLKIDGEMVRGIAEGIREVIGNKGVDTSRIRELIDSVINEDKLRASPVDFGLVTVSLSDFKPLELFKEDIPKGQMTDYLLSSAHVPGLRVDTADKKKYLDGGFYNNCPINLLLKKGYKDIIVVHTYGPGVVWPVRRRDVNIIDITPSEDVGRVMDFDNEQINYNLKLGYYDACRVLDKLAGRRYYIRIGDRRAFMEKLLSIPGLVKLQLAELYGQRGADPDRALFDDVLPRAASAAGLAGKPGYQEIVVALLETLAREKQLERFNIYSLEEFVRLTGGLDENTQPLFDPVAMIKESIGKMGLVRKTAILLGRALVSGKT